jgi:hypothetical protein
METNLAVFRYLRDHPAAKAGKFPQRRPMDRRNRGADV